MKETNSGYDKIIASISELIAAYNIALPASSQNIPVITDAIDNNPIYLNRFNQGSFQFPPLQIEYLISTLNEHIDNCLKLRSMAHDIEVESIRIWLDLISQISAVELAEKFVDFDFKNSFRISSKLVDASINLSNGKLESQIPNDSESNFFFQEKELALQALQIKQTDIDNILSALTQPNSAFNYNNRHKNLASLFEVELSQAYQRALALHAGLKEIFAGVIDLSPVPPVTNTGYLDELAIWSRKTAFEAERHLVRRSRSVVQVPLRSMSSLPEVLLAEYGDFEQQRETKRFHFRITEEFLRHPTIRLRDTNPRVQGIAVEFFGLPSSDSQADNARLNAKFAATRCVIEAPSYDIRRSDGTEGFEKTPVVRVAPIVKGETISSRTMQSGDILNSALSGVWEMNIDTRDILALNIDEDNYCKNIILYFEVTHD